MLLNFLLQKLKKRFKMNVQKKKIPILRVVNQEVEQEEEKVVEVEENQEEVEVNQKLQHQIIQIIQTINYYRY
jgi:hypothetical protein